MGEAKTNSMALASMVLAIVSVLSCCGSFIPLAGYACIGIQFLTSLLAIILGIIGKKRIAASGGTEKGDAFALIGIIIGILFMLLFVVWIVLFCLGTAASLFPFFAELIDEIM